ncbi:MAG: PQQ-binding-like beta-propeller repeat protein, partial [Gemmataceae bacterium]
QLVAEEAEDAPPAGNTDLTMFGGTVERNLVNVRDKGIPDDFAVKKGAEKRVKWVAKMGNHAYGGPIVAGGRVFVGTNNANPRDPAKKDDLGVVMCFDEATGKFLWQITHDKLPDGETNDSPKQGVASSPAVEGKHLYYVSNRCELVCAGVEKGDTVWKLDMIKDLKVFPGQLANASPLIHGDLVYAITGHGVDIGNGKCPNEAPAIVAVNKATGKVAWSYTVPAAAILRGQWSSPAASVVGGKLQVLLAGGDGYLYGLSGDKGELLWKFDCNKKKATPYKPGGSGEKCFIVGVPVVVDGKALVAVGQEPDDGQGEGHLWCIDITKKPANADKDLSPVGDDFDPASPKNKDSGLVWHYGGKSEKGAARDYNYGRTITTVAVHDGLVYASELAGFLHAVDLKTGKKVWEYDLQDSTWCSPYYADGKVFVGTDGGDVYVVPAGRKEPAVKKIEVGQQIKVPPVVANGVLYVNNGTYLYAIK